MRRSSWLLSILALVAVAGFTATASGSSTPKPDIKCPKASFKYKQFYVGQTGVLLDVSRVVHTRGTTCKKAEEVMTAWTKCRMKADDDLYGRCTRKVLGYSCRESRTGYMDQQSATVVCSKGKSYVGHYWNQRYGQPGWGAPL